MAGARLRLARSLEGNMAPDMATIIKTALLRDLVRRDGNYATQLDLDRLAASFTLAWRDNAFVLSPKE
jgi:hypothetical protein